MRKPAGLKASLSERSGALPGQIHRFAIRLIDSGQTHGVRLFAQGLSSFFIVYGGREGLVSTNATSK